MFMTAFNETHIQWKRFDSKITDISGNVIFEMKGIEAPAFWSQTAVDITASKYFQGKEKSVRTLVRRILKGLKKALVQSKILKSPGEVSQHLNDIKRGLYFQEFAFNSPVWFNCGVHEKPQCSACFIQSVDDSMESIFNLLKTEAMLFKFGSGTGTNFTPLRSKYEKLNSGGQSSGLISFLEIFDKSAGSIKSGGTTRRAAKMVCLDVDHPEIIEFIEWKMGEEKKARALISAGFEGSLDGEVYRTISGQNSNNSVRVTHQFMNAVDSHQPWQLRFSSSKKVFKKVSARDLWQKICQSAWECADPGIQFHDTINEFNMCADSDQINASNPCSEFMFLDNTACNLASLNLVKFFENQKFDIKKFQLQIDLVLKTQEALVDYSSYPTAVIAENSAQFRPLGLGYANLGSLLMEMGRPYESESGRAWAAAITAIMTGQAYVTSAQLARVRGPFQKYKKNKKSVERVIQKQVRALRNIDWSSLPSEFKSEVTHLWKQVVVDVKKYGLRNSQVTVIAPTGTIGLVMDCGTTGIEPDYALIKTKKLSGGGTLKITNPSVEFALRRLNYSEPQIKKILKFIQDTGTVLGCSELQKQHLDIFRTAQGEHRISAEGHLLMMAAVQPFLSGAISKTVNLPAQATVSDVAEVYKKAWKLKLKSVSVYRDQSKFIQPLSIQAQNKCIICKNLMILESGCYKCHNCGFVSACVG